MEPRAVLADSADDGRLTLRMSSQMPSGVRNTLVRRDARPAAPTGVRVMVGDVGGGFGMKTGIYPEDVVVACCALHAAAAGEVGGRAQRGIPVRRARPRHAQPGRTGAGRDGKILALRVRTLANVGAYATGTGVAIQLLIGPWVQTSVYDIQTIDFHFSAVLTNTAPTGAYRGAGRPEAIYIIERLMDEAARQTGIDRHRTAPAQLHPPGADAVQQPDGPDLRQRPVRAVHGPGRWRWPTGPASRRAPRQSKQRGKLRGLRHRDLPGVDRRQRASRSA